MKVAQVSRQCRLGDVHPLAEQQLSQLFLAAHDMLRHQVEDGGLPHSLRSEEHTSELQSRQYLVCRLLLEKKKMKNKRRATACSADSCTARRSTTVMPEG